MCSPFFRQNGWSVKMVMCVLVFPRAKFTILGQIVISLSSCRLSLGCSIPVTLCSELIGVWVWITVLSFGGIVMSDGL